MSAKLKKVVWVAISIFCGLVFILSAATKLFPIESFEISIVDTGLTSWKLAPVSARLLIGLEFGIGLLFICLFKLRKFTIPLAAILLIIFTIYLAYTINLYGNNGNCGCFGDAVVMTPLAGILKNVLLFGLLGIIYLWSKPWEFRFKTIIISLAFVGLLALPFVVNPISYGFIQTPLSEFEHAPLQLDSITAVEKTLLLEDTKKGKHVVAFLSPLCPHCKIAAKKLVVIKNQHPDWPIVFIIYNNKEHIGSFFDDTRSYHVPHILVDNKEQFLTVTEGHFPRIYFVNNSVIEYETNYFALTPEDINSWLKEN